MSYYSAGRKSQKMLIFFRRVKFVQPRTLTHFTADDVIISLASSTPKFVSCACACGFTDHRGEKIFCFGKLDVLFDHFYSLCLPSWHTFFTHKVAFWSDNRLARSTLKIFGEIGGYFRKRFLPVPVEVQYQVQLLRYMVNWLKRNRIIFRIIDHIFPHNFQK